MRIFVEVGDSKQKSIELPVKDRDRRLLRKAGVRDVTPTSVVMRGQSAVTIDLAHEELVTWVVSNEKTISDTDTQTRMTVGIGSSVEYTRRPRFGRSRRVSIRY